MFSLSKIDRNARQQLLMLCIPLGCLILALTWLTYYQSRQHSRLLAETAAATELAELQTQLADALAVPLRDLSGIARAPLTQEAIAASELERKQELFAQSLYPLIYQNPDYYQVRWIQGNGREGVRIDIHQDSRKIQRTPTTALQDKSHRPYHQLTMQLQPYQLLVFEPDLNREFGELEQPLRPTLRLAIRLPDNQGIDNGYLIINFDLQPLLTSLTERINGGGFQVLVSSADGDWVLHPDASLTWASDLGHDRTLANTNPALWASLQDGNDGKRSLPSGHWYIASVAPARRGFDRTALVRHPTLTLMLSEPASVILARRNDALQRAWIVFGVMLVIFTLLSGLFYHRLRQSSRLRDGLRHKARELTDSNQFINTLANALPGLIAFWDQDQHCQYANATHQKWLDLAPDELNDMALARVLGEGLYQQFQPHINQVLRGDQQSFELELPTVQGTRTVLVNLLPFVRSGGHTSGFISVITDISETVQVRETLGVLNEALKERSEAAENALRVKSAFLANMSHEIRTPMNGILGLLHVLGDTGLTKLQRDYVDKINGAGNALLQVLNDVLDLSKLDAGKLAVTEQPFSIEAVIKQTVQLFELGFGKKQVELLVWIDPQLPSTVIGDDYRLGQVLNNLMGNALKFTEQGSVTLSANLEHASQQMAQVRFSVKDTGIGIDTNKQSYLFDAFDQADTSTTRKYGGSGLGLAICKNLVELMGGEIAVHSQPGEGSEFHFTLPYRITSTESPWNDRQLRGIQRVLLVEDNDASAELLQSYLATWRIRCKHVTTAEDGLAEYLRTLESSERYDALLVDWILPGKDGVWLLHELQGYAATTDSITQPVVVMVTAHLREDLETALNRVVQGTELAMPSVLSKPVTPSALYDVLTSLGQVTTPVPRLNIAVPDLATLQSLMAGSKLLLVEDNELNQEVALSLLAKLGLSADIANNGVEALDYLEQEKYSLVLMDLHMPNMDGYEATRRIRERYPYYELPVIAMTAAVFEEDIRKTKAAGMNDHIPKPVDFQVLTTVLCKWLNPQNNTQVTPVFRDPDTTPELNLPGVLQFSEQELLARFQGDRELVVRLLRSFVQQYERGVPEPSDDDPNRLRTFLHTLKGSAATLGMHELAQLATEAERDCQDCQPDTGPLREALASTLADIRPWLDSQEAVTDEVPDTVPDTDDIHDELLELQELISRSRLPSQRHIDTLQNYSHHPKLGDRFQTLLRELDDFRYQSALVTLAEIEREI